MANDRHTQFYMGKEYPNKFGSGGGGGNKIYYGTSSPQIIGNDGDLFIRLDDNSKKIGEYLYITNQWVLIDNSGIKIGLNQLIGNGQRNYSVGASTYTADKDMMVLAVNQNINGEASNQTLTCPITCDGTLVDEDTQTATYSSPNRNHCTHIAFYRVEAGDTITLSNTHTGSYTTQMHLLYEVKNIEASEIDIAFQTLKLQSDNSLGTRQNYSIVDSGIYLAVGIEASGAGGTNMETSLTESGADESAIDNGILTGVVSAKIGILKGANILTEFGWADRTNYVTRGYMVYKIA